MTNYLPEPVTKQYELFSLAAELVRDAKPLLRLQPTIEYSYSNRISSQYQATCQMIELRNQLANEIKRLSQMVGGQSTLEALDKIEKCSHFVKIITVNLQNWL